MIFCKVCGEALNLFETHDEEICYVCLRKGIEQEKPVSVPKTDTTKSLPEALLSHEVDKLVLRSPEGWVLWSGPDNETYDINTILNRASRINDIRRKRRS